jgi:outer membrane protein
MKKILLTLVVSLFAFSAFAAELTRIAVVDLNKALNESDAGKDAVSMLEDMVKTKQVTINEKGEQIKKIEEELAKQSSILTPEAIKEKKDARLKVACYIIPRQ